MKISQTKLRELVERYQKKVFPLAFYLIGGNPDLAYEITADSFVETFITTSNFANEEQILIKLIFSIVERSRQTRAMPSVEDFGLLEVPSNRKPAVTILRQALQKMSFDMRLLLLLRDQLHLTYSQIARIVNKSEKETRLNMTQARLLLRQELERLLNSAR
ncbi:MAG: hypothetical protein N2606_03885 [Candidatus Omnitrophica bacterium]|nr:hypothetical protein [Candidatus Omnitrophota bacterium]